jgi:hypothetical protein
MARIDIKRFHENKMRNSKSQALISAEYFIVSDGKEKLLQINSFGQDDRDIPGKISQTIQLDQATLEMILKIYNREFK